MNMNINKQVLLMGAGAGTGVLVPVVLKKYVDPMYAQGIMGMPLSTFIPLVTGGIGVAAGLLTSQLDRFKGFKDFILMYSFAAFVSGLVLYAQSQGWLGLGAARAPARNYGLQRTRQYGAPSALGGCSTAVLSASQNCQGTNQIYRANCGPSTAGMSLGCQGLTIIA